MIDKDQRKYLVFGLRIAGDFGATIAIPAVLFTLAGRYLAEKYGLEPWGTIGGLALAALLSGAIIYKKAKEYGKEYMKLDKPE